MDVLRFVEFKIVPPLWCDCYDEDGNYIKTINLNSLSENL